MRRIDSTAALLCVAAVVGVLIARSFADTAVPVSPVAETKPVPSTGDAADDPAIWVHPQNPALSTIIGTDKKRGLAVYDLAGRELQFRADGRLNNVDLRTGFPLAGQSVVLVTAGDQADGRIAIYRVNPQTRALEDVAARKIVTRAGRSRGPGACMYRSAIDGKYYYIVTSNSGAVEQWELYDNGAGRVDARQVRSLNVGSGSEGCVADDQRGSLYIGLENRGIRKYKAEPNAGSDHVDVDTTGGAGHLTASVEGLALYLAGGGGYLLASSQGSNEFVVYERDGSNDYVATFEIIAGNGIDGVTDADGIDAVSANLGPSFPQGLFVAQDGTNDNGNQNFKLVSWAAIATAIQAPAPQADVSVTKTDAPDPVTGGGDVTYTVTVTNNGASDVTGVVVTDTLPASVLFVSASPGCTELEGEVTCEIGDLASGDSLSVEIVVSPTMDGVITNTAILTNPETDSNPANNSATAETTVNAAGTPTTDLSVTQTDAPDPVLVGDPLTYTATVTNNGPDPATGVTLTDTLPAQTTFVSASTGCSAAGNDVVCNLGDLASGSGALITITVTPSTPGTISNTARVSANENDPGTLNNTDTEPTTVTTETTPTLTCDGRTPTLTGTASGETLNGTSGADVIHGLGGADTIRGLDGDDLICGGAGNDTLYGENGDDRLFGEDAKDRLNGGSGADLCDGGAPIRGDRATSCEQVTGVP